MAFLSMLPISHQQSTFFLEKTDQGSGKKPQQYKGMTNTECQPWGKLHKGFVLDLLVPWHAQEQPWTLVICREWNSPSKQLFL